MLSLILSDSLFVLSDLVGINGSSDLTIVGSDLRYLSTTRLSNTLVLSIGGVSVITFTGLVGVILR